MDLPSSRELELEALLRDKDTQLFQLGDEVTRLRQCLSTQPTPSTSDPISLPPTLVSVLLPHIALPPSSASRTLIPSHTATAALTQRAKLLQEENDELYELLKKEEVGKLKEEVRGLRHVVGKLENALQESHQVIASLSAELDKSYEALMSSSRQVNVVNNIKAQSMSPRNSYLPSPQHNATGNGNGHIPAKPPPTGPRAYKKPRISEANSASPQPRFSGPNPAHKSHGHGHSNQSFPRNPDSREFRSSEHRSGSERKPNHAKMDIDQDQNTRRLSPAPERTRERDREHDRERSIKDRERVPRERERERFRERDRDGNRTSNSRRNGHTGQPAVPHRGGGSQGPGAAPPRRADRDRSANGSSTDRTLAERMGL